MFSKHKATLCGTGVQWGKTTVGAMAIKMAMHTWTDPDDHFLVCAPTYKIMEQSTLPPFLKIMQGLGEWKAGAKEFHMYGGGVCYFRTGKEPDSVVGITNVRRIWGDEAGKFSLYFWENIQARSAFKDCQIWLTTSPYTLNWIYKDIIKPKLKNPAAVEDTLWIRARSDENPYFPKESYEKQRKKMDPRRFKAIYGGEWTKMAGLVYDCFDEVENSVPAAGFQLPEGAKIIAGVDWGYTNPCALVVRAICPNGDQIQIFEYYAAEKQIDHIVEQAKRAKRLLGIKHFWCGPDQPGHIQRFNEEGLSASAWDASAGSVRAKIDCHYELIKTRRYKILEGTSPFTIDEYDSYHYPDPEDAHADDDVNEALPVKANDHAMDANSAITFMERYSNMTRTPRVATGKGRPPRDDVEEILARIKKPSRTTGTEDFD